MGMGVVSDEDFLKQVSNTSTKPIPKESPNEPIIDAAIVGEIVDTPSKGRKEGDNNVPESLRNLIGSTAAVEGRKEALALAKMFGISSSSASAYANGATSTKTYNKPKKSITDVIRSRKDRASNKALSKLDSALNNITDDKLESVSARDLSSIAKDMSAIVKNMTPDNGQSVGPAVNFVLFAPPVKSEEAYESVLVSE